MVDVLGVGALNIDLFYEVGSLEWGGMRFVPGGEVMGDQDTFDRALLELRAKATYLGRSGGGSAANCVLALSRMGLSTAFLGNIGLDEEGDFLLEQMQGVDMRHVGRGGRSGLCLSLIKDGDRALLVMPNANDMLSVRPDDIALADRCRVVHLTSFAARRALGQQVALVEGLRDDVIVSLDPGERYARRGLGEMMPLLSRTDVLFVDEREVGSLTGMGPREGGERLLGLGPDVVVVKSGAKGSLILTSEGALPIAAVPAKVVDKTGAGDVYAAGFLAGLLRGWSLRRCGEFASLVAARSIEGLGRSAYPDRNDLEGFARARSVRPPKNNRGQGRDRREPPL